MSNPNSTDDLDFGKPAAPAPKGRSSWLAIATLFVVAGGLIMFSLSPLLGEQQYVMATSVTQATQVGFVQKRFPDYQQPSMLCWAGFDLLDPIYEDWGYAEFSLAGRPATFVSARLVLIYMSYNYTWTNVSLVTAPWQWDTITWNSRPPIVDHIGYLPSNKSSNYVYKNTSCDVTPWVASGTVLSICLSGVINGTYVQFSSLDGTLLEWAYLAPVSRVDAGMFVGIALAAGIVLIASISIKKMRGGG